MDPDKDLALLEDWIRRIKIEYEIYFAGNRRTPPYDLKNKIESVIKRYYDAPLTRVSDRFRLTTLADRYNAHREVWRRQLQRYEEQGRKKAADVGAPSPKPLPEQLSVDVQQAEQQRDHVERLYEFYQKARQTYEEAADTGVSLAQFQRFVEGKTAELQQKYQADTVVFQVKVVDGAVKLTAKARSTQRPDKQTEG